MNRDVLVTTVAAMIGAAITAVAHFLQFSWLFGGDEDESPLGIVGTIAAILIAPIAAMILQLAVSRQREYLADATAAKLLGEGRPLAYALESLQRGVAGRAGRGQSRDGVALHRQPPLGGRDGLALLDASADGRPGSTGSGRSIERPATSGSTLIPAVRASTDALTAGGLAAGAANPVLWPRPRKRSTRRTISSCPGRRRRCRSASGRSTSTACTRTSASSSRSSSRRCSTGTFPPADACSIPSQARARRSCRRSSPGTTRPVSTSPASTRCSPASRRARTTSRRCVATFSGPTPRQKPSSREAAIRAARRPTCAPGSRLLLQRSCCTSGRSSSRSARRMCCGSCWPARPAPRAVPRTSTSSSRASPSSSPTGASSTGASAGRSSRPAGSCCATRSTRSSGSRRSRPRGPTASSPGCCTATPAMIDLEGPYDGVITSPPYPGLIDYHEQHRYAYELLGVDERRDLELGRPARGTGRAAIEDYVEGVAAGARERPVVARARRPDVHRRQRPPRPLSRDPARAGLRLVDRHERHVNRRTGRRAGEYYESILVVAAT